jgi:hypothetical protein
LTEYVTIEKRVYDGLLKRMEELEKKVEELTRRLKRYENPNTPPSKRIEDKKKADDNSGETEPPKYGAPLGHKGATRETPEPDRTEDVVADHCENCGSSDIRELDGCDSKVVEEVPPPQKAQAIQYNRHNVECMNCGHCFVSKHKDCPKQGNLGINLLGQLTVMKVDFRLPFRKIRSALHLNAFDLTPMGINNALTRVGEACKGEYEKIIERIRAAKWVHVDETGMKVRRADGTKGWLWLFRSSDGDILVVICKSRGKSVPQDILGADFKGAICVDGWCAYNGFKIIQRCWAHLLREVDAYLETEEGKDLSTEIHAVFKELREFIDSNPSTEQRKTKKAQFDRRMKKLVMKYMVVGKLQHPVTYITNGLGSWFTCVLYLGMEPTNNLCEQSIREHVVIRKIIGMFRSEKGSQVYQYIASLFATWKLKGADIYEGITALLSRNLCLAPDPGG